MIQRSLSHICAVTNGHLLGAEKEFAGLCTDSREPQKGALFVALRGDHHDGHEHVNAALKAGCVAALVETGRGPYDGSVIEVADSLVALGQIAADWCASTAALVLAVTGSNGKTTVKNMLSAIFSRVGKTHSTGGNFNNEIGVPLTLAAMPADTQYLVLEMGAAKAGDIAYLCRLVRPDVGLVTNAGGAHLKGFGSIEGVARAKGEMFSGLADSGCAIINADDDFSHLWRSLANDKRQLSFGLGPEADVYASDIRLGPTSTFSLRTPNGCGEAQLKRSGQHDVRNALAAAAAALALDVALADILTALASFTPPPGRLDVSGDADHWLLLDDSYNANPASLMAGIEAAYNLRSEVWVALGDMAELGDDSDAIHFECGLQMRRANVQRLFTLGPRARHCALGFGDNAQAFESMDAMSAAIAQDVGNTNVVLLVKGSRRMRMERLVQSLKEVMPCC